MKNPIDSVGNRIRDLLACHTVPQLIVPPRAPYLVTSILEVRAASNFTVDSKLQEETL